MKRLSLFASVAGICLALTGTSQAASLISATTTLPADMFVAPSDTSTGTYGTATGSVGGQFASPFADNTSLYGYVQSGYVTYNFSKTSDALSLVFGSPDNYNLIRFYSGTTLVDQFNPSLFGLSNTTNYFVTIKAANFDSVQLASGSPAFEYSNVNAVPLPASAPLFGAALLALGAIGYGVKRKQATAA